MMEMITKNGDKYSITTRIELCEEDWNWVIAAKESCHSESYGAEIAKIIHKCRAITENTKSN